MEWTAKTSVATIHSAGSSLVVELVDRKEKNKKGMSARQLLAHSQWMLCRESRAASLKKDDVPKNKSDAKIDTVPFRCVLIK